MEGQFSIHRLCKKLCSENLDEIIYLGRLIVDGWRLFKWLFKKQSGECKLA
jgi:hypothetical protein